jgi:hypothetical protein
MAAFWAVFTFGGSGPDITAHGSLDLKQEIQIQILLIVNLTSYPQPQPHSKKAKKQRNVIIVCLASFYETYVQ